MTQDSPNIDASPQDPLLEIGPVLKGLREEQGLTLESLAAQTKIQRRILVAIEAGDWSSLPEPVYVQGFIRRYGNTLGLDGNALARKIPMVPVTQSITPQSQDFRPAAQLRPFHLYGIYIALIVAAVWGLSTFLQRGGQNTPLHAASAPSESPASSPSPSPPSAQDSPAAPEEEDSPAVAATEGAEDADSESPSASSEDVAIATQSGLGNIPLPDSQTFAISAKPVNVNVKLTSQAWVRIVIDGEVEFEGILPEKTERTWTADQSLVVRSGNAGAVLVAFNGADPEPLGDTGAVDEVEFAAENL
ncbi:MAG: RodZ domain-containing protein [Cyanobacteria bacterium P01_H01_bin.130]